MIYEKFLTFLQKHPKKINTTHTDIGKVKIPYSIKSDELDEFYKLYSDVVFNNDTKLSIVEKLQEVCPLVIDLDFKYINNFNERQYTNSFIKQFIKFIFEKLAHLYNLEDKHSLIWIMEKQNICNNIDKQNYKSKDGIHILLPSIHANIETYKIFIDEILNDSETLKDILNETCLSIPDNNINEIIDKSIYTGNWLLYGSGKEDDIERNNIYTLTNIYKFNLSSETFVKKNINLYLNSPIDIIRKNSVALPRKENITYTEYLENKLKDITKSNNVVMKTSININLNLNDMDIDELIHIKMEKKINKEDINIACKLVNILNADRSEDYKDWIQLGFLLNTLSQQRSVEDQEDIIFASYKNFSKKSSKYNENEIIKQWNRFTKTNKNEYTLGTLHYWAKMDNMEEYNKIMKEALIGEINNYLFKGLVGEPNAVARTVYKYFKNMFIYINSKKETWYFYNDKKGGKWELTNKGMELKKRLSTEIFDIYDYVERHWKKEYDKEENDEKKDDIKKFKINKILAVKSDLLKTFFKKNVIEECKEFFDDKEFMNKLDQNTQLIGFENGIYDLNTKMFRQGLPDDYISLSTGYPLKVSKMPIELNNINNEVQNIVMNSLIDKDKEFSQIVNSFEKFIKQVIPIDDVRNYLFRFLSSCLSGEVREEKFRLWTGSGGNGKSKIIELFNLILGNYSGQLDVSYLTNKRGGSSQASPELENIRNARFVYLTEPDKNDTIFVGKLKQITGGDKLNTRQLYGETSEFKPQFKMVLMCNELPELAGNDGGTWRRIEVLDFISKFVEEPNPNNKNPHIYLMDKQLQSNFEYWKILFMIKLLNIYNDYNKSEKDGGGTQPPPEVLEATERYKCSNDIISQWYNDHLQWFPMSYDKNNIPQAPIPWKKLQDDWKLFCTDNQYNDKSIKTKQLQAALIAYQIDSSYGWAVGKNTADKKQNGTNSKPYFNIGPEPDN
jgi:P4 family phage/plasmid primase-like protien